MSTLQGDANVAAVGKLLADEGRCRMLLALGDGRALPASQLAREARVAPSTASEHLSRLREGGMVEVERHGRHRYYRLSGREVMELLEGAARLAPPGRVRGLREAMRAEALRDARTCYDHLAGRLGVEVLNALLHRGVLEGHDGSFLSGADRLSLPGNAVDYRLGPNAGRVLEDLGLDLSRLGGRRPLLRYCVDWSEQRHHLAGALGAAIAETLFARRWLERSPAPRVVRVTDLGLRGLREHLGLDWAEGRAGAA
ncbi:MAG TPA: metalloregulator ArsR/SmtB family transcription factor [Candidatus Dormibacteraeota bacterium]|jgi:DNA-binding transcriptional ArsR family regulator|nr:metalloregulator ArsR/SmtB family transcription factor [Candidatus Dormibacteraeota bacterium]